MQPTGTESLVRIADRQFEHRESSDHGHALSLLHEANFRTQLDVAWPVVGQATLGPRICQGHDGVKLHVGNDAVVDLEMRRRAGHTVAGEVRQRREIEFPVPVFDGLGIVRDIRRARMHSRRCNQQQGRSGNQTHCDRLHENYHFPSPASVLAIADGEIVQCSAGEITR